jgi:membrane-bound serine protease (ClpP class)
MRVAALAALLLSLLLAPLADAQAERVVDVVEVKGVIDPPVSDYLRGRLDAGERDGVHAIVIQLDTPGGLDISMREIIQEILDSDVPVIVWIAPRGARAASAGTFITYAANLAYMAEATEIGAATPVNLGGGESDDTLSKKVTEDAAAYIEDIARTRGRNAEWAVDAVRKAASVGSAEAVRINVVDGVASTLRSLLEDVDGESVEVANGSTVTLETWDEADDELAVTIRFQQMNLIQRLLHAVTNPEVALLLVLFGTFGIIFEIYNPGIGLAGILGAVSLLLGFYALSVLPTNWAGAALVILSVIFFVVDVQTAGLGIWTVGGITALVAGSMLIFSGVDPALSLSPWVVVGAVAVSLVFFVSVMTAALRVRLRRPITGEDALVGLVGEARTDIAPEGTVLTKGSLWRARTMETGIAAGEKVRVKATEGLTLLVEPLPEGEEDPTRA